MRARTYLFASLASLGVLGVGIGAGVEGQLLAGGDSTPSTSSSATTQQASSNSTSSTSPSTSADSASTSAASSASPSTTATSTASGLKDGTYTGSEAQTRYGPVAVEITVKDGKITSANATEYPTQDGRDQQINSYAVPILNSEVTAAQSASISQVSGATFTSEGYVTSLQSALEEAQA